MSNCKKVIKNPDEIICNVIKQNESEPYKY